MSPTAWTPTVPDEIVVRLLERLWGTILPEDVGPTLGQAAVLASEREADPSTRALIGQAMRIALADHPLPQIGAVRMYDARLSPPHDAEWLKGMRPARPELHRVTP